jgi:two-component system sensor histidine kinase/response regulator
MDVGPQLGIESILIIDDMEANRQFVEDLLGGVGYAVIGAASGEEGLRVCSQLTPDLILLDLVMPGLDGIETFKRLRQLPAAQDVPVVFMTGVADSQTHQRVLDLGADDFLCKPISPTELLIRVRSLLRLSRLNGELRRGYETIRSQRNMMLRIQKQKLDLMSFVLHDLNIPLADLREACELLSAEAELPAAVLERLHTVAASAATIQRRVGNVIDINRSEDGRLSPQLSRVYLPELLGAICAKHCAQALRKQLEIVISITPRARWVRADSELLRRIVENLLDNAVRCAPPRSTVRVEADTSEAERTVELRVCDQGPGIPVPEQRRLFDKAQLDERADGSQSPRRGIGLVFCRLAAEAQGGSIGLRDNPPRGSVFFVRIPASPDSQTE